MAVHTRDMDNPPITAAQLRVAVQQAWVVLRPVRLGTEHLMGVVIAARGGHILI